MALFAIPLVIGWWVFQLFSWTYPLHANLLALKHVLMLAWDNSGRVIYESDSLEVICLLEVSAMSSPLFDVLEDVTYIAMRT